MTVRLAERQERNIKASESESGFLTSKQYSLFFLRISNFKSKKLHSPLEELNSELIRGGGRGKLADLQSHNTIRILWL